MEYEAVIGLEVHAHLKTETKAFCACSTEFGKEPNSQTCPVCLGFPGSLPVFNQTALDCALRVSLALDCKIQEYTKFDRKNYFYPDLPKGYQISQYDLPLAREGFLDINLDGKSKRINIIRIHLEEDAGKLIHQKELSLVDFNRAGIPLLEIVSSPDISSPEEAHEYLIRLKNIIEYTEVSDCDMEKGSLRCDANISVRKKGIKELGIKTELKNMNSFKAVREALRFEIERQIELLEQDKPLVQETRLWDEVRNQTHPMRTKEEAQDYRYFPEPDLPPFIISQDKIAKISQAIPELPQGKIQRFIKDYGISEYASSILAYSKRDADYAEGCIKEYPDRDKKPIVNWLIGPLLSEANNRDCKLHELKIPGGNSELVKLVKAQEEGRISNLIAKSVLAESIANGVSASKIIQDKNLFQISDAKSLEDIVGQVIRENPKSVNDYKKGKTSALMFLVGQTMKKSKGKSNPKVVQEILKGRLNDA